MLNVRRSIWQRSKTTGEKETKDHQRRRIALDAETVGNDVGTIRTTVVHAFDLLAGRAFVHWIQQATLPGM